MAQRGDTDQSDVEGHAYMPPGGEGNGIDVQRYRLGQLEKRVDKMEDVLTSLDRRASAMLDQIESESKDRHELSRGLRYGLYMMIGSGLVSGLLFPLILKFFFH